MNTSPAVSTRTPDADADLLEEIRDRFDLASAEWQDIRDEGDTDMRYVSGDPWDPAAKAERQAAKRPCLALDELGQYYNQIINDVRANPIGMEFSPTGPEASPKGAEFYADKGREIEYRSHAQIAYTTAFENAVQRSFGWCRVTTKFESDKSPNQEIWIDDIPDPNSIVPDPDFKRPDFSDGKYLFELDSYDVKEFKRRWPKAKITDFTGDAAKVAPKWIQGTKVQVAGYWKIETTSKQLASFRVPGQVDPQTGQPSPDRVVYEFTDDLAKIPAGAVKIKDVRTVDVPKVMQYVTNGLEILERKPWAGKYIPFAACFGKVLYLDEGAGTRRKMLSMTRLARDPYMLYCYYRTAQAEVVGRTTKNAAIGYKGQFRGVETEWQKSIHEPMAFLEANWTVENLPAGTVLPLPQLNNWEPPIQALEMGAEGARRAIQAAMGSSPLPTDAQRKNQKSGIALQQMESSGQKGSFHFVDHYRDMIRHVGVMVEDLMDKIYDTSRSVGVRKPNDTAASVPINDPANPEAVSTQGDYLTTVSAGPATDSLRQAASDFADQLAQNPQVFPQIADLVVKMKDLGPIGDEIADRLTPPQYREQNGQPPDPKQMQMQLQQATQELQQAKQTIALDTAKEQARQQGQLQLETMKAEKQADLQIRLKEMDNAKAIEVARIAAGKEASNIAQEAAEERLSTGLEQQHEDAQNAKGRAHDVAMAAMGAQHASDAADQAHANMLDVGDASAANQMATAAHAQAIQPPEPEPGPEAGA